ncbi:MAG: hypothetical protein PHF67_01085 [Candidatus Nanoarchaeia archaeon]|nr:hypothetical protein [Candidatus Nanoarchaeia archaeon]
MVQKGKKAQGEIITTVIIIILVLASIVIVWQVVQSSVSKGGEQGKGQSSCIGLNYVITKAVANATGLAAGAGNITIRRNTGAPDVASFQAKVFVDGVDTGKTILVGGELNTTLFKIDLGANAVSIPVGSKVQLAPIVGTTQCGFGPEKTVTLK